MSKELEAFETVYNTIDYLVSDVVKDEEVNDFLTSIWEQLPTIKQALHRLEAIDNANPSEALECLEKLKGMEISSMPFSDEYGTQEVDLNDIRKVGSQLNTDFREYTTTIKQALLKAQEQDKKKATCWDIVVKKNVDMLLIKKYDNVSDYNSAVWLSGREKLTQEEFNLLKECLE